MEPNWNWGKQLKAMAVAGIAAGYVSLVFSLFKVWDSLL